MPFEWSPIINDSQLYDVPLNNNPPINKKMGHTTVNIPIDKDGGQRKKNWFDNEHKVVMIAILILMAIVFFSLAGEPSLIGGRCRTTVQPSLKLIASTEAPTTTIQSEITTKLDENESFSTAISSDEETTTMKSEVTTEEDSNLLDSLLKRLFSSPDTETTIIPIDDFSTLSSSDSTVTEEATTEMDIIPIEVTTLPHPDTTTTAILTTLAPITEMITIPIEVTTVPHPDTTTTTTTIPTTLAPIQSSVNQDRPTHYTKLDFAKDEWYKPVYSLFNAPATYEKAENICKTPLKIGDLTQDQTLPSVHMYEALINKVVEMMPSVYGGKAMWTGFYTPASKIGDLNDLLHRVYGPSDNEGQFYMVKNTHSFCPPFNDESTAEQVWNTYKMKYRFETAERDIQIVKDFTYSNEPKTNWPPGWFPGCMRPYNSSIDPIELNFVCQTNFLDSTDIENWKPLIQKLPFHLNRMKIVGGKWDRKRKNFRKMPSSDIDNILHTLQLISVPNQLPSSLWRTLYLVLFQK